MMGSPPPCPTLGMLVWEAQGDKEQDSVLGGTLLRVPEVPKSCPAPQPRRRAADKSGRVLGDPHNGPELIEEHQNAGEK